MYVDDVAPPTSKPSDAKCHPSLLRSLLLDNVLYFGDNKKKNSKVSREIR